MGTLNRTGQHQIEVLINYMESHCLFARSQITKLGPQGHLKFKAMWAELARKLNATGPSIKNVAAWQKYWTALRLKAKSNMAHYLKALNKTGHDTVNMHLSVIDQRISNIFGKYGSGINLGRELGFPLRQVHIDDSSYSSNSLLNSFNENEVNSSNAVQEETPARLHKVFNAIENIMLDEQRSGEERQGSRWSPLENKEISLLNLHRIRKHHGHVKFFNLDNAQERNMEAIRAPPQVRKATDAQLHSLIDFMERYPRLANETAENDTELWMVLTTLLNNTRGVRKSTALWQRTWKSQVKAARQSMTNLLNGSRDVPMTNNHIRIIDIVGYREEPLENYESENDFAPTSLYGGRPHDDLTVSFYENASSSTVPCSNQDPQPSTSTGIGLRRASSIFHSTSTGIGQRPLMTIQHNNRFEPLPPPPQQKYKRIINGHSAGSSASPNRVTTFSNVSSNINHSIGHKMPTPLATQLSNCFREQNTILTTQHDATMCKLDATRRCFF